MDFYRLAVALIAQFYRIERATRPIDRKVQTADLRGMTKAANRLGIGMTDFQIEMTLRDIIRDGGDRPGFNAANNQAQQDWDAAAARKLADALAAL